jgi:hypothetical protein
MLKAFDWKLSSISMLEVEAIPRAAFRKPVFTCTEDEYAIRCRMLERCLKMLQNTSSIACFQELHLSFVRSDVSALCGVSLLKPIRLLDINLLLAGCFLRGALDTVGKQLIDQ